MRERGIAHRIATVAGVDVAGGAVHTDGGRLPYDQLVIATGATTRSDEVPGLAEHARQISSPSQLRDLGDDLRGLARRASRSHRQRVLVTIPAGNCCPTPLYELTFLLDTWLRRHGVRDTVELGFTSHEYGYLQAVNPMLHELTAHQFDALGIDAYASANLIKVDEREAVYADGHRRPFDLMVTFAPQVAAVEYRGLPVDGRGFLRCEPESRAVIGHPEIHAPGDAGDHPVKQAYLATMQATAAAMDVVAEVTGRRDGNGPGGSGPDDPGDEPDPVRLFPLRLSDDGSGW
jgi:sulfide:quinone oxidoreductase